MRLHKEHGLNPTISTCIYCGGDKEIVLLGAAYKNEAPMKMIFNTIPCDKCKELFEQGFLLVMVDKVSNTENNPLEVIPGYLYADNYWLFTKEWAEKNVAEEAYRLGRALVTREDAKLMGLLDLPEIKKH